MPPVVLFLSVTYLRERETEKGERERERVKKERHKSGGRFELEKGALKVN